MPEYNVTTPDGRTFRITAPEGATQAQALEYAKAHAPEPEAAPLRWRDVPGAIMDTFSDKPIGGAKDTHTIRRPTDVLWNPQSTTERLVGSAVTAPLIAAGGGAVGALARGAPAILETVAPAVGRVATQGALSKVKGEDWPSAFLDMAGAVLGEGAGALVGKAASKIAGPAVREGARQAEAGRVGQAGGEIFPELDAASDKELWGAAQQWGRKQVERVFQPAIKEIEARLGGARALMVPSVSAKPISMRQAVDAMFDAEKAARRAIRTEIDGALTQIDPMLAQTFASAMEARGGAYAYLGAIKKGFDSGGKFDPARLAKYVNTNYEKLQNYAGRYWPKVEEALLGAGKTAPVEIPAKPEATKILGHTLKVPMGVSKVGEAVAAGAADPAARALVDAALGTPPFGGLALAAAANAPRRVLRHVPGGRYLDDLIADEADDASGH